MNAEPQRFDVEFQWPPGIPLLGDLRRLVQALEARFQALEQTSGSFETAVDQFQELGLIRLNDVLTPLATEAIERLQDVTGLFEATSDTEVELGPGLHVFVLPLEQRNTFVPTPYIGIYAVQGPGIPAAGMIAERISFDRETGQLSVASAIIVGSGIFSDWILTVSPSPNLVGYTAEQTDTAIAAAIAALGTIFDALAPLDSPELTGIPLAPNPLPDDSSTQIATTAFVAVAATNIAQDVVAAAIAALPGLDLDEATAAQVRGATIGSHAITTPLIAEANLAVGLTDGATIGIDWKTGINFTVTLGGNRTLGNPSNGIPGTWRTILVTQDANGMRTLGYGNQYVFPYATEPVIATGDGAVSRLSIYCRSVNVFEVYGIGIGLAP